MTEYEHPTEPKCYVKSQVKGLGLEKDKIYKVIFLAEQTVAIEREQPPYDYSLSANDQFFGIRSYDCSCFEMQDGGNILCDVSGWFDPDDAWNAESDDDDVL